VADIWFGFLASFTVCLPPLFHATYARLARPSSTAYLPGRMPAVHVPGTLSVPVRAGTTSVGAPEGVTARPVQAG
jgi:hypothetical protein